MYTTNLMQLRRTLVSHSTQRPVMTPLTLPQRSSEMQTTYNQRSTARPRVRLQAFPGRQRRLSRRRLRSISLFLVSNQWQADSLAIKMQTSPIHANQETFPSVRMLDAPKPAIAATATKTAVQVPCVERELRPIEMPSIPEPATKIQSGRRKSA